MSGTNKLIVSTIQTSGKGNSALIPALMNANAEAAKKQVTKKK